MLHVGVQECVFHIDDSASGGVLIGVIPVSKATYDDEEPYALGQFYNGFNGDIWTPSNDTDVDTGVDFEQGDVIAVTLDLDAEVVTFARNGETVPGAKVAIAHEPHYFAFSAWEQGVAVTIREAG